MCSNVFFASAPTLGIPGLQQRAQAHNHAPRGAPWRAEHPGLLLASGADCSGYCCFLVKAAGASSVLRLSEDQTQRKTGSDKLVQEVAT